MIRGFRAKLLLPIFIFGFSSNVQASRREDCTRTFNLPDFLTEVRNQGQLGWCYAFAGADLLSAYAGDALSAAHIAIVMNAAAKLQSDRLPSSHHQTKLIEGGFVDDAVAALLKSGRPICREVDLSSKTLTIASEDPVERMTRFENVSLKARLTSVLSFAGASAISTRTLNPILKATFPHLTEQDVVDAMKLELPDGDEGGALRLRQLADANCKTSGWRPQIIADKIRVQPLDIKSLDAILSRGAVAVVQVPVVTVLRRATNDEKVRFRNSRFLLELSGGAHEMLLTGRRWNLSRNRCEYVFKNSWGVVTRRRSRTVDGYTYIPETRFSGVRRGAIISIDAPVTWASAPAPF